jgi:DNA adenine methylase
MRPALRYHGGKWKLAEWIIAQFPPHRVYVEPFGGGASVLLRKPRTYAEIYNDLDEEVVGLFRVLRDRDASAELQALLAHTPFARAEFEAAYEDCKAPIERSRRLLIRSFMGFGSDGHNGAYRTGFRANSNRRGTTPAHDWVNYAKALPLLVDRLQGVVIENRDACDAMRAHDGPQTLHYVDPPYPLSTRSRAQRRGNGHVGNYRHEMTDADHAALLAVLQTLEGAVVLSGYPHPMYDEALKGWQRIERKALADGARPRTEVLWIKAPLTGQAHLDFAGCAA